MWLFWMKSCSGPIAWPALGGLNRPSLPGLHLYPNWGVTPTPGLPMPALSRLQLSWVCLPQVLSACWGDAVPPVPVHLYTWLYPQHILCFPYVLAFAYDIPSAQHTHSPPPSCIGISWFLVALFRCHPLLEAISSFPCTPPFRGPHLSFLPSSSGLFIPFLNYCRGLKLRSSLPQPQISLRAFARFCNLFSALHSILYIGSFWSIWVDVN